MAKYENLYAGLFYTGVAALALLLLSGVVQG